jgi:muramoyltetrapeptide carboxypeptidase
VAVIPRTKAGLAKFRPVRPGSQVALVAPASSFSRAAFDAGVAELRRIGLAPVFDESVLADHPIVAGPADLRARTFAEAATRRDIDAVIAVRGGYGSAEMLPYLDAPALRRARTAFVGYSDLTSLHAYLNGHVRVASVHGAMLDGRLSAGPAAYDPASLLASLGTTPLGEFAPAGLEVIRAGEASGPIVGGTLTQLAASLGTPYEFLPPPQHVLFLEDVNERPYRLRRLLTQLRQSGRFASTAAIVFGQMDRCDEPGGGPTSRDVIREFLADFPGPILFGFPSGHTTTPFVSVPFGVQTRIVASGPPRVVFVEAAAE